MIVLDAYGLVALLTDQAGAAAEVETLMAPGRIAIASVNLAEAVDVSTRLYAIPEDVVRSALTTLAAANRLAYRSCDEGDAWRAAELRRIHYDRKACALSLADCFLLASAEPDDEIATADPAVAAVARKESIGVIPLPDSSGRRP